MTVRLFTGLSSYIDNIYSLWRFSGDDYLTHTFPCLFTYRLGHRFLYDPHKSGYNSTVPLFSFPPEAL